MTGGSADIYTSNTNNHITRIEQQPITEATDKMYTTLQESTSDCSVKASR